MPKHQFKAAAQNYFSTAAEDHGVSNFATDGFFDYTEVNFDFSDESFVALSLESISSARGGNGGGGKKDKPGVDNGDSGSTTDPVDSYISGSINGLGYNIEIQFVGDGWTDALKEAFIEAADFLSAIIVGDRPDYIAADDPNNFFNQDIDDILITAELSNIDGEGGILGQAGPTHIIYDPSSGETGSDALPFAGSMEFDIADAQTYLEAGTWSDIVFHEMVHTLGFGTLWERTGVVDLIIDDNGTKRPVDDSYIYDYTGIYASSFTDDLSTEEMESPLVETDGGSGTAGGHWDEDTYGNELMTGYINDINDLSQMSMASLADLGYELNWDASEYTLLA